MVQFVREDRLYYIVLREAIEYSYMDITKNEKKEPVKLQLLETINKYMIDKYTSRVAEYFFHYPYSIYNVNH
jgi:hypothetical protein